MGRFYEEEKRYIAKLCETCEDIVTQKNPRERIEILEVTIHGTITIDPQSEVEAIEDLMDFMSHNHNNIYDIRTELELDNNIRIVKIEETK